MSIVERKVALVTGGANGRGFPYVRGSKLTYFMYISKGKHIFSRRDLNLIYTHTFICGKFINYCTRSRKESEHNTSKCLKFVVVLIFPYEGARIKLRYRMPTCLKVLTCLYAF